MRHLFLSGWRKIRKSIERPLGNQDGSVILIALILLLAMSIIGFSAGQTSISESYILRNTAIHTQNISLLESAALSLAERVLIDIPDPAAPFLSQSSSIRESYIIRTADWNNPGLNDGTSLNDVWYNTGAGGAGRVLSSADGTTFPQWVAPAKWVPPVGTPDSNCLDNLSLIYNTRGEAPASAPMRVALVGWVSAPGSSLKGTKPTPKVGTVMAEYISPDNGMMRLVVGIRREF
jgi:hypothetical protein